MFVACRKECSLWKLEGDISVSEGEILSEFEWWDTTCPRARAQEDLLHSQRRRARREYGMRLKRSNYAFVTFGVFDVCNAYCGTSRSGIPLIWKSERARLSRTRTFDLGAQKGRSSESSLG